MEKQSIESMYKLMDDMRDKMGEVLKSAQDLLNAAKTYGGEISRVMNEQLTQYFGPALQKLINDDKTPGSIVGLIKFMDSIPLSYTRIDADSDIVDPVDPTAVDNANIDKPATLNNELDNLPRNASFLNPVENDTAEQTPRDQEFEDTSIEESLIKKENILKESLKYQVVRTSSVGSPLGEEIANLEDTVIAEYNSEEEAQSKVEELNKTVLPSEKDLLGTEYKVETVEITEKENTEEDEKKD